MMGMVIFCVRALGNGMIVVAGSLIGFHYAKDIQKRYEELYMWKKNFRMIYGDISYGGITLIEVLNRVEEQSKKEYKAFFHYVAQEISACRKRKLGDIWNEGVDIHLQGSSLIERDKKELKFVGQYMGNVDKKQQLAMIQMYLDKVECAIQELECEKDKKMKLYRTLGILGSIFVVILFL